jgi:hypothetical protein
MKNRDLLEKPFAPEQIKQRKGSFGDVLDYIEGVTVVQRLNECLNGDWAFEVLDHRIYEEEVVVLGKLTLEGISKAQFGKSKITRTRDNKSIVSMGDDLKAAATDALKKCATLFGVGLHLYFDAPQNGNGQHSNQQVRTNSHENGGDSPGNDNGRLTAKQLSAIFSLAKGRQWSNKDVRDFTHEMFGKMPDFLTKREASAVIQHLQGSGHD